MFYLTPVASTVGFFLTTVGVASVKRQAITETLDL